MAVQWSLWKKYDAINYTTVVEDVLANSEWFECVEALDEIRERTGIETLTTRLTCATPNVISLCK